MLVDLEREMLDLAAEDYTALADIYATICAAQPRWSHAQWLSQARQIATKLLDTGFVELFYDDWSMSNAKHRCASPVPKDQVQELLDDDESFEPRDRRLNVIVAMGATKAGEDALHMR